ncbi:MAG TPA: hypothetical protein VHV82_06435 [Sporichthyaceae bacterium]|jgi:hypothetical protein|nr:hypothetical protein [Sporichthyaceae bacterium]
MRVLAATTPFSRPSLHFFNVLILQTHVWLAGIWAVCAVLTALIAVPQLRRIPSAVGLHALQVKSELLVNVMFGVYVLTFGTGTWLLYKQATYRPPFSRSAWDKLRDEPYGIPYYYALYSKIILFFLMGVATVILARQARRVAGASEASGGPVDMDLEVPGEAWLDEEVLPEGTTDDLGFLSRDTATMTSTRSVAARSKVTRTATSPIVLWACVAMLALGLAGVGFDITLIKYFHELSKSAVVYQILTRGGGAVQG